MDKKLYIIKLDGVQVGSEHKTLDKAKQAYNKIKKDREQKEGATELTADTHISYGSGSAMETPKVVESWNYEIVEIAYVCKKEEKSVATAFNRVLHAPL